MLRRYPYKKVLFTLLCVIGLCVGCDRAEVAPTATIPVSAPGSISLTYIVQRGSLLRKVAFDGRISPVEDVKLYFRAPGYVKQVHVKLGDQVRVGDLLAELEIDELQNQIAQAEVALNSAQQLLSAAETSLEHQRALAELNLEVAKTILAQVEDTNAYAISQAELSLSLAQEGLDRLAQAEDSGAYAISQAELSLALVREELTRTSALEETYASAVVGARVGLEQAQDGVARAEIEYGEALDRPWEPLDVLDAYARTLQQARWNLEIAQAQYDQAVASVEVYQSDLRAGEIVVRQAEEELKQLQDGADVLVEAHQSDLRIQEIAVKQVQAE
ncbi:MAG: biotin/lipoyl-binding protein, partial [Anaerolineae bacterium]